MLTDRHIKKHMKKLMWKDDTRIVETNLPQLIISENGKITQQDYITKSLPIIEKQLLITGIRLASVLNETFNK